MPCSRCEKGTRTPDLMGMNHPSCQLLYLAVYYLFCVRAKTSFSRVCFPSTIPSSKGIRMALQKLILNFLFSRFADFFWVWILFITYFFCAFDFYGTDQLE